MGKFTWNDLQDQINKMDEKQRQKQVCVSVDDEDYFRHVKDVQFIEEDIYVNTEDNEVVGTLDDLKAVTGGDFDIQDYKIITPKGTPFLWDGF